MFIPLLVTIVLPIAILIYSIKYRKSKIYLLGCLTFVITQPLLRIPLLTFLSKNFVSVNQLQAQMPMVYIFLVALSAGIFEEVGRYIVMRFILKNNNSWNDGVLFGLGHGGIEALLLVGLPVLSAFFADTLINVDNSQLLVGSIERIFAIILHVGLSILVMKTVKSKRNIYFIGAILIHTIVNSSIGFIPMFISNSLLAIEAFLAISSILLFVYCIYLKKGWNL